MAKTVTFNGKTQISSTSRKVKKISSNQTKKIRDVQIEVLSHQYSEARELFRISVAERDRLFYYLLIAIFLLLLYMSAPVGVVGLLNSYVWSRVENNQYVPVTNIIGEALINPVLSFGLFYLSYTYFATALGVLRQSDYVDHLRKQLGQHFNELGLSRESTFYRNPMHKFSLWTKGMFYFFFPSLFLLFNVAWLSFQFTTSQSPIGYKIIDILITAGTLYSLLLYLLAIVNWKRP